MFERLTTGAEACAVKNFYGVRNFSLQFMFIETAIIRDFTVPLCSAAYIILQL